MKTQYHYVGNNFSGRDYEIISKYNLSMDSNFVASSSKWPLRFNTLQAIL